MLNSTDNDLGLQLFLDAEGWKRVRVLDPGRHEIVLMQAERKLAKRQPDHRGEYVPHRIVNRREASRRVKPRPSDEVFVVAFDEKTGSLDPAKRVNRL